MVWISGCVVPWTWVEIMVVGGTCGELVTSWQKLLEREWRPGGNFKGLPRGLLPLSRPNFLKFTELPNIAHQLGAKQSTHEPVGVYHIEAVAQASFPDSVPAASSQDFSE